MLTIPCLTLHINTQIHRSRQILAPRYWLFESFRWNNFASTNISTMPAQLFFAFTLLFQEIVILGLASTVGGDKLSSINISGLVVCLTGISLHVYLKYQSTKCKWCVVFIITSVTWNQISSCVYVSYCAVIFW